MPVRVLACFLKMRSYGKRLQIWSFSYSLVPAFPSISHHTGFSLIMTGLSIFEFALLDDHSKKMHMLEHGVYLISRRAENFTVHLYRLPGFYVELFMDHRPNPAVWFRSFDEPSLLEPYVNTIRLEELY
jgi:hypothetical protein